MVTMSTIIKSATLGGEISIINNESNQYKAEIKGIDELTGIAVLQVKNATFTRYVDLKSINPSLPEASMVLSIQRPYNLPASPEPGMIGGFNRAMGIFDLEKYIQSNLRLYPGNEGAPVFGPAGQLVGMIAKEYRQGEWPGITFIIPADMIIDSALSIIETGERERGWIPGLVLRQEQNGIMIEHIEEGSPAIKAGLMKGDMIVGINGAKENNMYDFRNQLLSTKPHEPVNLLIQRGTRQTWVQVKTTPVKLIPITKTTP
jgi:serine protease Do